jgi:hypothetical protein
MFRQEHGVAEVPLTLQVLLGTRPALEHTGALDQDSLAFGPLEFTYPPPAAASRRRRHGSMS